LLRSKQLQEILNAIANRQKAETDAAAELLRIQISNAQKLQKAQFEAINKKRQYEEQQNQIVNEKLIKMGFDAAKVIANQNLKESLKNLELEKQAKLKEAKQNGADKDTIAKIQKEYQERAKEEKKLDKARTQARKKQAEEESKRLVANTQQQLANLKPFNLKGIKEAMDNFAAQAKTETGEDPTKGDKFKVLISGLSASLANFTKQFESQIKEIAYAQSAIDTRLQGSGLNRLFGSY
jgi:hypothetical protein